MNVRAEYELRVNNADNPNDTVLGLFLGTAMIEIDLHPGSAIYLKTPPVHFSVFSSTINTPLKIRI